MRIGILRDKQQTWVIKMLRDEEQDVMKTVGKIMFEYLLCIKLC